METAFAFPRPKNVTDIMIVATIRMKTNAKAFLVICLNLDVPTAKNVLPNFKNVTIAKIVLMDQMKRIVVSLKNKCYSIKALIGSVVQFQNYAELLDFKNEIKYAEQLLSKPFCPFFCLSKVL